MGDTPSSSDLCDNCPHKVHNLAWSWLIGFAAMAKLAIRPATCKKRPIPTSMLFVTMKAVLIAHTNSAIHEKPTLANIRNAKNATTCVSLGFYFYAVIT